MDFILGWWNSQVEHVVGLNPPIFSTKNIHLQMIWCSIAMLVYLRVCIYRLFRPCKQICWLLLVYFSSVRGPLLFQMKQISLNLNQKTYDNPIITMIKHAQSIALYSYICTYCYILYILYIPIKKGSINYGSWQSLTWPMTSKKQHCHWLSFCHALIKTTNHTTAAWNQSIQSSWLSWSRDLSWCWRFYIYICIFQKQINKYV